MLPDSSTRGRPAAAGSARVARRGFVLVTMLCCLVILFAFLGLAVDAGYLELAKTRMQTAADAAALGGVQELKRTLTGDVGAAALEDAALNGFRDGQNGVTVAVHNPPTRGYYTENPTAVEVVIAQKVPTFFMRLVGASAVNLEARSVARQAGAGTCVHVLDPHGSGSFSVTNGVKVELTCGIMVESDSSTAFSATGGAKLDATSIEVHGGAKVSNGAHITPEPVTGVDPVGDPLAYVNPPAVHAGCDYVNKSVDSGTVTLPPGVYCNGITIGNSATVVFSPPGVVILKGGGLSLGGGSTVSGDGITFYNTAGEGYAFKGMDIGNGAQVTLNAPTTGPLAGILFFQDRNMGTGSVNTFQGGTTVVLNGSIYLPTGALSYSNGSKVGNLYSVIVVRTISFSDGTKVLSDYSVLPNGNPIRGNALVSE